MADRQMWERFMSSSKFRRLAASTACLALLSATFAGAAQASDWTPDSEATWVARTNILAQVGGDGSQSYDMTQLGDNMAAACDGLQSEQMAHEYGKEPRWALSSQLLVCSAYNRWSGKAFMTSKRPCHDLETAVSQLGEAKAGQDPDDVVQAAANLTQTAQMILAATANHRKSCVF